MRNKVVFFLIIIFLITMVTGCNNTWKSKIQASEFEIKDDYIVGRLKNTTNKAYDLNITFSLKSGNITEEDTCNEIIKENETIDVKCLSMGHSNYKVEIENIELKEKKIGKLKSGKIDIDTLEYYFKDIYEEHNLNIVGIGEDISEYPYISEIEYDSNSEIVKIEGTTSDNTNFMTYIEQFDSNTEDLNMYSFSIVTNDEEYKSDILTKVALMKSFNKYYSNSTEMLTAFNKEEIGLDKCLKIGTEWCVSSKFDNDSYTYIVSTQ